MYIVDVSGFAVQVSPTEFWRWVERHNDEVILAKEKIGRTVIATMFFPWDMRQESGKDPACWYTGTKVEDDFMLPEPVRIYRSKKAALAGHLGFVDEIRRQLDASPVRTAVEMAG